MAGGTVRRATTPVCRGGTRFGNPHGVTLPEFADRIPFRQDWHLAARRLAVVVDARDRDRRRPRRRVDQTQLAHLVPVAPRIEHRHSVAVVLRLRGRLLGRIVHGREEAVARAHVRQHRHAQRRRQIQAPVARSRPDTLRQALVRIARLEVRRIEVHRSSGRHRQRRRTVPHPLVVVGIDAQFARDVAVVHHPRESLALPVRGGREERHAVQRPAARHSTRIHRHGGEIREMARRRRHQAEHVHRPVRSHRELPTAVRGGGPAASTTARSSKGYPRPTRRPATWRLGSTAPTPPAFGLPR